MCTLIVIHRQIPGAALVVAANRDEFYERPAAGPARMQLPEGGTILAPRDLRAGGTWLGLNRDRVFAAITNRPNPEPDPKRRSRGLLVLDALGFANAEKAAAKFESLSPDQYNPFNLVVADQNDAFAVVCSEGQLRVDRLEPGAHVIGNAEPDDRSHPKTRHTLEAVEALCATLAPDTASSALDPLLTGLSEVCRSHAESDPGNLDSVEAAETSTPSPPSPQARTGPLSATCVHLESYGTRSSILLQLSEDPELCKLYYADGAPCAHPYENLTPLLRELSPMVGYEGTGTTARKAS